MGAGIEGNRFSHERIRSIVCKSITRRITTVYAGDWREGDGLARQDATDDYHACLVLCTTHILQSDSRGCQRGKIPDAQPSVTSAGSNYSTLTVRVAARIEYSQLDEQALQAL